MTRPSPTVGGRPGPSSLLSTWDDSQLLGGETRHSWSFRCLITPVASASSLVVASPHLAQTLLSRRREIQPPLAYIHMNTIATHTYMRWQNQKSKSKLHASWLGNGGAHQDRGSGSCAYRAWRTRCCAPYSCSQPRCSKLGQRQPHRRCCPADAAGNDGLQHPRSAPQASARSSTAAGGGSRTSTPPITCMDTC